MINKYHKIEINKNNYYYLYKYIIIQIKTKEFLGLLGLIMPVNIG